MSPRVQRGVDRTSASDQRRTSDRRTVARDGNGHARGRRATDAGSTRAATATDKSPTVKPKRRSTSDGREPLVIYLRPESIKALKMAALEGDTSASAIVASAVDGWLRINGRSTRR